MQKILAFAFVSLVAAAGALGCAVQNADDAQASTHARQKLDAPVRYVDADAQAVLDRYAALSLQDLDGAFAAGRVPAFEELQGDTAGRFLARNPKSEWWAAPTIDLLFENCLTNWTGKRFVDAFAPGVTGSGINLFDNPIASENYRFDTYLGASRVDGQQGLVLDYRNYFGPMSGLVDDVREVEDGVVLGQMYYYFAWSDQPQFVGYFMLVARAQ